MTSPTIDLKTLCDKFALRFVAATIGTPSGAAAIRGSYGQRPKGIPATPFHYLSVEEGDLVPNPGQWKHTISIDGTLVLSKRPGDPTRVDAERQRWLPYLLHATVDQMQVTLGGQVGWTVDKIFPDGGWEFLVVNVGGEEYDGIQVHWHAYITETVTLTP